MSRLSPVLGLARLCAGLLVFMTVLPLAPNDAEAGKRIARGAAAGAYAATRSNRAEASEQQSEDNAAASDSESEKTETATDSAEAREPATPSVEAPAEPAATAEAAPAPAPSDPIIVSVEPAPVARAATVTLGKQSTAKPFVDLEVPGCGPGKICTVCLAGCPTGGANVIVHAGRKPQGW
jgi:hypothetical protein